MTPTYEQQARKIIDDASEHEDCVRGHGCMEKPIVDAIRAAAEEKEAELSHGRQSRALIIAADARKKAFRECKPYIDHHWECATRDPKMAGMEPCDCGLDDLREKMEGNP